ncbi:MAG: stage II sporulation protein M, partial [Nitrosopumilaceae archaeon]|nr:stage II sporulation protein M [Nitrosopumilaceae archaeon]NIU01498.1 stage II sporulation protein M [Nitrosopumilaceae archaeon]NIU87928.1 stage II sporulation protein M [Nitrosopumilaceae archaeon]NIV66209.1 stage II sporulation protein M [Nitrosopumilaceae archaeon]NIX62100.1 stage II sporulation protein M [Nitrosopumilaceae archaeon]
PTDEEAKEFLKEFETLVEDIDSVGIFLHNTSLALPMFIPGFGVAWGLFSGWSTGFAFSTIVSQAPELAAIPPLAILYLSPFGIMELTAYSLAISRSFILVVLVIKKQNLSPAIRPTLIEVGIVVGLLLAGGFLEFYMIEMVQDTDFEMPGLS